MAKSTKEMYKKVVKKRLVDEIIEQFMDSIARGEFKKGERLPTQEELKDRYSVGRNTMREALQRLEVLGIVTIRHGDGTYLNSDAAESNMHGLFPILSFHETDLEQLAEVRSILEAQTVKLATLRASKDDINELLCILKEMEKCKDNVDEYTELDWKFHLKIAQSTHNNLLSKLVENIYVLMRAQQEEIARMPRLPNISFAYHVDILKAIDAKDARMAEVLMLEHLNNAHQRLKKNQ